MILLKTSVISLKNVTIAIKVKKLLKSRGIESVVIKLDASEDYDGECASGIEFHTKDYYTVIDILRRNNISFKSKTGG